MRSERVLLIVAFKDFQPVEFSNTKEELTNAGIVVDVASNKSGEAIASDGTKVKVDMKLIDVCVEKFDGIFIIGGPGALEHLNNDETLRIMRDAKAQGKLFGAICISPRILAEAGLMISHEATGWDGDGKLGEIYKKFDVVYKKQPVVIDGNIITASGPSAAEEFGKTIVKKIKEEDASKTDSNN